jgi:Rap1a immunity proteins
MRNPCPLLVVLVCLAAVPLLAQEILEAPSRSGNAFLQDCSVVDKPVNDVKSSQLLPANVCLSYVKGLLDGVLLQISLSRSPSHAELFQYCMSGDVTNAQVVRILLKYIRANPATAHLSTAVLFGFAMKETFPCPVGQG